MGVIYLFTFVGIRFLIKKKNYLYLAGLTGITCLLLSVRLAYASLQQKLKARVQRQKDEIDFNEVPETKEDGETHAYTEKIPKVK